MNARATASRVRWWTTYYAPLRALDAVAITLVVVPLLCVGIASGTDRAALKIGCAVVAFAVMGLTQRIFGPSVPVLANRSGRLVRFVTEAPLIVGAIAIVIGAASMYSGHDVQWLMALGGVVLMAVGATLDAWRRGRLAGD